MIKSKKGFTLIEMLVAVIIVAILASTAILYYGRFMERMRMTEVLQLFGTMVAAQERTLFQKHHYTRYWSRLDAGPNPTQPYSTDTYQTDAEKLHYHTRRCCENNVCDECKNDSIRPGFDVYFIDDKTAGNVSGKWFIVADREGGWGGYSYTLLRALGDTRIYCIPNLEHKDSVTLCLDFMGVGSVEELPADPREVVAEIGD